MYRNAMQDRWADDEFAARIIDQSRPPDLPPRGLGARTSAVPFLDSMTEYDEVTEGTAHTFMLNVDELGDPLARLRVRGEKPSYAKP